MRPDESFIGQPIRSLQQMLRVISKSEEDSLNLIPDGIYGNQTAAAVTRFQQNHAIPATGITDLETWDHIVEAYENAMIEQEDAAPVHIEMSPGRPFSLGDCKPDVYMLQAALMELAQIYGSIPVPVMNGTVDEAMCDCVAAFQATCGLTLSGTMDKRTWKNLALQLPLAARVDAYRHQTE